MKLTAKRWLMLLLTTIMVSGLLASCGGAAEVKGDQPPTTFPIDMGEFTTNIRDSKKLLSSFIKIDITDEAMLATFADKDYVAKDSIVRLLRELNEADVKKDTIQSDLAEKIKSALNTVFDTECVYQVYFVRFVYQ